MYDSYFTIHDVIKENDRNNEQLSKVIQYLHTILKRC